MAETSPKAQDFFKYSQTSLKIVFLNSKSTKPLNLREKALKAFQVIYSDSFIFDIMTGYFLMIIYAFLNRNDFVKSTTQLPSLVSAPAIVLKAYLIWTKREVLREIVDKLNILLESNSGLWEELKLEHSYQRFSKHSKRLAFGFTGFAVVNSVGPLLHYISKKKLQLPVQMWFPFDASSVGTFPFVYAWVVLTSTRISMVACGCDLSLYGFLTLISTQFEILSKKFEKIDVKSKDLKKNLIKLMTEHEELLKISDKIQEIFSKSLSANFFGSSLGICMSGFQFTYGSNGESSHLFKYAVFVVLGMLQIFTLCSFSQQLIDSSLSVAQGAFNMKWWEIEDLKVRRLVQFIIMRSQRHKKLRALQFAEISLENFTRVSFIAKK